MFIYAAEQTRNNKILFETFIELLNISINDNRFQEVALATKRINEINFIHVLINTIMLFTKQESAFNDERLIFFKTMSTQSTLSIITLMLSKYMQILFRWKTLRLTSPNVFVEIIASICSSRCFWYQLWKFVANYFVR